MLNFISQINKVHTGHGEKKKAISFIDSSGGAAGIESYGDQETLNQVYENIETVYRCVFMAANNIASLPKKVFRKNNEGDDVDVTDLFPLINNPNDQQTERDFWIEAISRNGLQGEIFWEMLLGRSGIPEALFADWRSEEVSIKTKDQMIIGYKRVVNGKPILFDPEEVLYIHNFNPYQKFRGLSPLRSARHSVQLDLEAVSFNKKFFKQGMKINGILQTEQELDSEPAERLRKEFEKIYSGVDNMHKTAVLHSGLSFTALNDMSMSDAQFMELRTMNRENIAMAYGTPLEVLGIGKATFENEKYARRKYWTETLIPEANRIANAVTKFLIPRLIPAAAPNTYEFRFITKDVEALKEDRSQKVTDYQIGLSQRALTPNEMRVDVFGKPPFEDETFNEPVAEAQGNNNIADPNKHICDDGISQKKKYY